MEFVFGIAFIAVVIFINIKYNLDLGRGTPVFQSKITDAQKQILVKYFEYYNQLPNDRQKKLFEHRVANFIKRKEFIPSSGLLSITEEMKVLIAASAMQISFGYNEIYFAHFSQIIVFPEKLIIENSSLAYEGKVNLDGKIFLSWKNFVLGYKNPEDGRNLGLHEMAHALFFQNAYNSDEYNFLDRNALYRLAILTKREILAMKNGDSNFFRAYASTNRHEFFAVAIENFFERPTAFLEAMPDLYHTLALLLKQDPASLKTQPVTS